MAEAPDTLRMRSTRRRWLGMALMLGAGLSCPPASASDGKRNQPSGRAGQSAVPALAPYRPEPPQPAMKRGIARVNGGELAYIDTGGAGAAVILLHAYTGSVDAWSYQLPTFARAGYRVIAYSRRGHAGSGNADGDRAGRTVEDLEALADYLGVRSFHVVGTAAGGFVALDYAIAKPGRLLSLTIASSLAGVDDAAFNAASAAMTPRSFYQLPAELREIGPSYRAAYPKGVERWAALEAVARAPGTRIPIKSAPISLTLIGQLDVPCLLMTGSADLYIPPSHMARLAKAFRRAQLIIIPEAGHAAYWEQPDLFNHHVLGFLRQHRRRAR